MASKQVRNARVWHREAKRSGKWSDPADAELRVSSSPGGKQIALVCKIADGDPKTQVWLEIGHDDFAYLLDAMGRAGLN